MSRLMVGLGSAAMVALASVGAKAQVVVQRSGPGGGQMQQRVSFGGSVPMLDITPGDAGVRGWQVGQWARYSISQNVGAPIPMTQVRQVSIVGRRGTDFWVEVQDEFVGMMTSRGPVRKMAIPFGAVRERVGTEVYVLMMDSSVRRETLVRAGNPPERREGGFPQGWERVGEESVSVVGGTFRAIRWRRGDEQLWVSSEAAPLGVVKYTSNETQIELAGRSDSGARSRVPYGGGN